MKVRASVKRIDPDRPRRRRPQIITDRSPLHASALRLRDVHPGVQFVDFNTEMGIYTTGVFLSDPFVIRYNTESDDPEITHCGVLVAKARTQYGDTIVYLEDSGIAPYGFDENGKPIWNEANVTVRANKAGLLPKPFPLDQGYPSPADIFDIYDGIELYVSPEPEPVTEFDLR